VPLPQAPLRERHGGVVLDPLQAKRSSRQAGFCRLFATVKRVRQKRKARRRRRFAAMKRVTFGFLCEAETNPSGRTARSRKDKQPRAGK
jgi:hypothetical protein